MTLSKTEDSCSWKELLLGSNGWRALALSGGVFLHATDVFLATAIMPSVISDLEGLSFYS